MEQKQIKPKTKGGVILQDIKVGDIHYEFEYGMGIQCEVLTEPVKDEFGVYHWTSKNVNTGSIINYADTGVGAYCLNLYDYIAYAGVRWI